MQNIDVDALRSQLADRRQKLQNVITQTGRPEELVDLIVQVDVALEKMDKGTYGKCETCHDSIEPDRLAIDPLIKNCLDHLSATEQRMLEHDLDLAFSVQSNLLPKQGIGGAGWMTAYHYSPAGPVSGDYCDILPSRGENDPLYFFVGDISGKGVAASILMAHLHAIFRSLLKPGIPIATVLAQANRLFCEGTAQKHFATLVFGSAEKNGTIEICNAAHCRPLILRRGRVESVDSSSLPLGLFAHGTFSTQRLHLDSGEALLLYTDGLIEARNTANELYGEERLINFTSSLRSYVPGNVIDSCLNDLSHFIAGTKRIDDLTLLALQKV
jgi:sigma-B regulation protein RsbU (phosphoserine phosphatase)